MASRSKTINSNSSNSHGPSLAPAREVQPPQVPGLTFLPKVPHLAPLKGEHASVGAFFQALEELARTPGVNGKPADAYTCERDLPNSPAPCWEFFFWNKSKATLVGTLHTQASLTALREQLGL